jgi:hypothetical protein
VIVKTDLNCWGLPERQKRLGRWTWRFRKVLAAMERAIPAHRIPHRTRTYPIYQSLAEVPEIVWANPGLVAERFLPEMDAGGFSTRAWVFLGDRESCTRILSDQPIVKADAALKLEKSVVPDEIRAERARLGFDFGKFDFVIREGQPILLDINKTPGAPPASMDQEMAAIFEDTAAGIGSLINRGA